jgi:hypothetical protein
MPRTSRRRVTITHLPGHWAEVAPLVREYELVCRTVPEFC